jgi:Flp pilus assembly protein TadG
MHGSHWAAATGGRACAGTAAIEFALVAPILVILLMGIADYATMASRVAALDAATRAGAAYARSNPANAAGAAGYVTNFMSFTPAVTPAVTTFCQCVSDAASVQRTCPATPDASPCTADPSGNTLVLKFVSVRADQAFSPLLAYAPFVFPATLSRTTTLRLQ